VSVALKQPTRTERYLLGAAFFAFLAGTALLYFWGPWTYPMNGPRAPLITFLIAVHAAFATGYLAGVRGGPAAARIDLPVEKLLLVSVVVQLALLLPTSRYFTGDWIPNPWAAAHDFGRVYAESLERRQRGIPIVNYVRILLGPLIAVTIPFAVFYWRRLPKITKVLFVTLTVATLVLYMAIGTNVAAGELMALLPWFVIAAHISGVNRLTTRGWLRAGGVQILAGVLFAVVFTAAMLERSGSFAKWGTIRGIGARIERLEAGNDVSGGTRFRDGRSDAQFTAMDRSPSAARVAVDGLVGYVTQGYYAVYLSLREPFVPCYGVGHSAFLQRQVVRITGLSQLLDCSYVTRIQKRGWNASGYWATIYPWIASDVTFPGTIVVVFFIGWLAGRVWLDVLGGHNPLAVALLGQVLLILYFFPAHNRVMQMGENVTALMVFLGAWLMTRQPDPAA
jgi:hypothetical protein